MGLCTPRCTHKWRQKKLPLTELITMQSTRHDAETSRPDNRAAMGCHCWFNWFNPSFEGGGAP